MKKLLLSGFILTLLISTAYTCHAEDSSTDEWNEIGKMDKAWDGQKIITDEMFEKVIQQRTKHSKEKAEKRFKKKVGESIIQGLDSQVGFSSIRKVAEDYPTLLVPKTLLYNEVQILPGYYRILSAKTKDGHYFINFYQGNSLVGKIPALETDNDFNIETINYAKIIYAEQDNRAKIVYGCIDYNLVAETGTK